MQRHGYKCIGVADELPPHARHPLAKHGCKVQPVAVLELVHEFARDVVVAHGGAGAVVGRWQ
jgi:hypothetical protein